MYYSFIYIVSQFMLCTPLYKIFFAFSFLIILQMCCSSVSRFCTIHEPTSLFSTMANDLDHHFFMATAFLVAKRSTSPTPVGAVLVNEFNQIIGIGYNKPLREHAEHFAIENAWQSTKNCTLYVTLHPCIECSEAIIDSGIKRIFFNYTKYPDNGLFEDYGVECIQYEKTRNYHIKFTNLSDEEDYERFSWRDLFMAIAYLVSMVKRNETQRQVGVLVVNNAKQIVGIGYKTMNVQGVEVHAEVNAFYNSCEELSLENCILYSSLYPCNRCADGIKNVGIKTVFYNYDKYPHGPKKLFGMGVDCIPHYPIEDISITFFIDYENYVE